jgi:hypothetical protein
MSSMAEHHVTINTYGPAEPIKKSAGSARALAKLATKLGATPNIDTVFVRIDYADGEADRATQIAREAGWSIG